MVSWGWDERSMRKRETVNIVERMRSVAKGLSDGGSGMGVKDGTHPNPKHPKRMKTLRTAMIWQRFCPLRKTTSDPTHRISRHAPHEPLRNRSSAAWKGRHRLLYLIRTFPRLSPTRHTFSARTNRSSQPHALNQPMKERVIERTDGGWGGLGTQGFPSFFFLPRGGVI